MTVIIQNSDTGQPEPYINVSFAGGGGATADFFGEVEIPAGAYPVQLTGITIFPRQVFEAPASGIIEVIPVEYELPEAVITPDDTDDKPNKKKGFGFLLLAAAVVFAATSKTKQN